MAEMPTDADQMAANESKSHLAEEAAAVVSLKGTEDGAQGRSGNYEREIIQQLVEHLRADRADRPRSNWRKTEWETERTGSKSPAPRHARRDDRRSQLSRCARPPHGREHLAGSKAIKRRVGHNLPDTPLTAIQSLVHVGTRARHEGSLTLQPPATPIVDG